MYRSIFFMIKLQNPQFTDNVIKANVLTDLVHYCY